MIKKRKDGNWQEGLNRYKRQRNFVVNLIRTTKKIYIEKKLGSCLNQGGKWKEVDRLMGLTKPLIKVDKLVMDQETIEDDFHKALLMRDYFIEEPLRTIDKAYHNGGSEKGTLTDNIITSTLFLRPCTASELDKIIAGLKTGVALGVDEISPAVVKFAKDGFMIPLLGLINLMFAEGVFPEQLKISRVVPIFKKGDKTNIKNYRPISLLSTFSKILEKLLYSRLITFLKINKVLIPEQYGFREKLSTEMALLDFWENINQSSIEGGTVLTVFLDLQKAFDCLDHEILLRKLESMGLRGMVHKLIASYLRDRKIRVRINGVDSPDRIITRGVPQGSSLGPLFFLLYINDITDHIQGFQIILYADDTTCIFKGLTMEEVILKTNLGLTSLFKWMRSNKLVINYEKTKYIIFQREGRKEKRDQEIQVEIVLNEQYIERVKSFCLLGIWIDSDMKWRSHFHHMTRALAMDIGRIRAVSRMVDSQRILMQLYYTFIYSRLTYGILLWGCEVSCRMDELLLLQKRCLRVVLGMRYCQPVLHLFPPNGILPIRDIYRYRVGRMMFNILRKVIDFERFAKLFLWVTQIHSYNTRNSINIYKYGSKTCWGSRTFKMAGIKIWNTIPIAIRMACNARHFKKLYLKYLLDGTILN